MGTILKAIAIYPFLFPTLFLLLLPVAFSVNLDYRYTEKTVSWSCGSTGNLYDGNPSTYMNCNPNENGWFKYNFTNQTSIGFTISGINISDCNDGTGASYPWKLMLNCTGQNGNYSQQLFNISFNGATTIQGNFSINVTNSQCFGARFSWYQTTPSQNIYCAEIGLSGYENSLSGGTQPSLSLFSDLNNGTVTNRTYFNFYFNGTSVNNTNVYNCGIFADGVNKASGTNLNLSTNKNFSFSLPNKENYVNFTLNCYNQNASSNLSALYYVDNVPSVLTLFSPNGSYYNDVTLFTNFTLTDPNLYFFEWLVYEGTTLKENITHSGIHGIGNYTVVNESQVTGQTGSYRWVLSLWENHNPLSSPDLFKEYDSVISESRIVYLDNDAQRSYSISSAELTTVTTKTEDLKQFFEFIPDKSVDTKEYTYYLEYEGTLEYLPNSEYQGHFVLWDIKRYVDFVCDNYVKVTKLSYSRYEIKTPCTKFETTGNLNFMQWTGNFTISTPPSLSEEYLLAIDQHIVQYGEEHSTLLNQIYGGISMIGFIILWLGLWIFGYYAMQTGNDLLGGTMIVLTLPVDFYFSYLFQEVNMLATGFLGIAFSVMMAWTLGVFILIRRTAKSH